MNTFEGMDYIEREKERREREKERRSIYNLDTGGIFCGNDM